MAIAGTGSNVRLDGPVNVWFDPNQPTEIHLTLNDVDLVHPQSGKDGLHLAVSARPTSANFDPKTFNTLRDLLARFDKPHPAEPADESIPRRLDSRRKILAQQHPPAIPGGDRLDELGVAGWFSQEQRAQLKGIDIDAMHSVGLAGAWTPELVLAVHAIGERRFAGFVHELGAAGPFEPDDIALLLEIGIDKVRGILHEKGIYGGDDPSQIVSVIKRKR